MDAVSTGSYTDSKYKRIKNLSTGTYRRVYLVRNSVDGGQAVGVEHDLAKLEPAQRAACFKEVDSLQKLKHPNIMAVLKAFPMAKKTKICCVMELTGGGDLYNKIQMQKGYGVLIPENKINFWFVQMCSGFSYLQQHKVVLDELTDKKVHLTENNQIKIRVSTLQHAKFNKDPAKSIFSYNDNNAIAHAAYFCSPEFLNNGSCLQQSDVWKCGVMLFNMVALDYPFQGQELDQLATEICSKECPSINKAYAWFSAELEELIRAMLTKDASSRPSFDDVMMRGFLEPAVHAVNSELKLGLKIPGPSTPRKIVNRCVDLVQQLTPRQSAAPVAKPDKDQAALQPEITPEEKAKDKAIMKAKDKSIMMYNGAKAKCLDTKEKTLTLLRNPSFQQGTVFTTGGAIAFGSIGGAFGCASGIVVGSAVGVVPALFTLGLSIPAGGAIGGIGGLFSGTLIGGSTGGIASLTAYKYRIQIKNGAMTVKVKVCDINNNAKARASRLCTDTQTRIHKVKVGVSEIAIKCVNKVKDNSLAAAELAKTKASNAYTFATTTKVGVTTSTSAAGAVVGGTTIGAVGTLAGAAAGVVPAIFTFGLSIPVGAMVGMCAGTAIGGSVGAVSGGVAGYTGFTHGKAIKENVKESFSAASSKAENIKIKALACAGDVKNRLSERARACTGGSAHE